MYDAHFGPPSIHDSPQHQWQGDCLNSERPSADARQSASDTSVWQPLLSRLKGPEDTRLGSYGHHRYQWECCIYIYIYLYIYIYPLYAVLYRTWLAWAHRIGPWPEIVAAKSIFLIGPQQNFTQYDWLSQKWCWLCFKTTATTIYIALNFTKDQSKKMI